MKFTDFTHQNLHTFAPALTTVGFFATYSSPLTAQALLLQRRTGNTCLEDTEQRCVIAAKLLGEFLGDSTASGPSRDERAQQQNPSQTAN